MHLSLTEIEVQDDMNAQDGQQKKDGIWQDSQWHMSNHLNRKDTNLIIIQYILGCYRIFFDSLPSTINALQLYDYMFICNRVFGHHNCFLRFSRKNYT